MNEPGVDARLLTYLFDGHPSPQGLGHDKEATVISDLDASEDLSIVPLAHARQRKTVDADLQGTYCLEQSRAEGAIDGHHFSRRLHLRAQESVR